MSFLREIEKKETELKMQIHQLDLLQAKIKRAFNSEERFIVHYFEQEINTLKDSLRKTEKELKELQQKNRKLFFFALAIFIIIILIYVYFKILN